MTAVHEVSAEREPVNIAKKRQQYFDIREYRFNISFFRKNVDHKGYFNNPRAHI